MILDSVSISRYYYYFGVYPNCVENITELKLVNGVISNSLQAWHYDCIHIFEFVLIPNHRISQNKYFFEINYGYFEWSWCNLWHQWTISLQICGSFPSDCTDQRGYIYLYRHINSLCVFKIFLIYFDVFSTIFTQVSLLVYLLNSITKVVIR